MFYICRFTGVFTSLIFKCIHKGQSDFVHLFINEPSSWESNICLFSSKLTFKTCFRSTNSKLIKKKKKEHPFRILNGYQVKLDFIRIQAWHHYLHYRLRSCCWYSTDNFSDPQSSLVTQQQATWQRPPGGRFGLGSRGNRSRLALGSRLREKERDAIFYQVWLYEPSSTYPCFDFI